MTCEQIALTVSALGVVTVGMVLALDGVTVRHRHLHFRSVGWRLAWWAASLCFFVGIGVAAFFCGSQVS